MATPTPSVNTYETVQKYWAYTSAVYGANGDPARTPLVVGSATPVTVKGFDATPDSGFGGALYKDASTGRYTLAFTGSETGALKDFVQDWGKADGKLYVQDMAAAMGTYTRVWNPQFTDAMNFAYGAVKQIYSDLVKTEGRQDVTMDDIRARLDVTGHSLGGALAELVGKLFGLKGANIDGPGVTTLVGLAEVQRAQRSNQYLGASHLTSTASNGNLGTWRAIALDLQGDGIQTVAEDKSGVVFDVDGTGYAKQTAWVGKGDGMLVLDRNFNGVIDTGSELFGNTQVALGAQGLKGLAWTDANVDGDIDARDAVYSQLRVWQDANGNGLVDTGEAKSLTDMGISSIHYNRGSYDKNGQSLQVSSVDLQVDSVGMKVEQVAGGIKIESTNGKVSVLVTKTDDLSNIAPGKDGVQAIEDIQLDSNKSLAIVTEGMAQHVANETHWRFAA